jgi:RNA polymerase sigma-70 factor (ECF subfamily)
VQDTPVVRLNRAVALAEVHGPAAALDELAGLERTLDGYHLLHATRAELLVRAGRGGEATESLDRARELAPTEAERRLLSERSAASRRTGPRTGPPSGPPPGG